MKKTVRTIAIVSTAFGFGPVSKAVALAEEFKKRKPDVRIHFFGSGIDLAFAQQTRAFDQHCVHDMDDPCVVEKLLAALSSYDAVVNVMNLEVMKRWPPGGAPMYIVDSLSWMWPDLPEGADRAKRYYVQDYLADSKKIAAWQGRARITLVGPVLSPAIMNGSTSVGKCRGRLLVNLSGCSNPFAEEGFYKKYAEVMVGSILRNVPAHYEDIVVCTNGDLSSHLRSTLPRASNRQVWIGHLAPAEFRQELARAELVLSSPGLTATLEGIFLGSAMRFLVPQNYSQALISEAYLDRLGDHECMALSRFSGSFRITPDLPESEGLVRVSEALKNVLQSRVQQLDDFVSSQLSRSSTDVTTKLRNLVGTYSATSGTEQIAQELLFQ